MASGYTYCGCPGCFNEVVSDDMDHPDLCDECEEAGCDGEGDCEVCDDRDYEVYHDEGSE